MQVLLLFGWCARSNIHDVWSGPVFYGDTSARPHIERYLEVSASVRLHSGRVKTLSLNQYVPTLQSCAYHFSPATVSLQSRGPLSPQACAHYSPSAISCYSLYEGLSSSVCRSPSSTLERYFKKKLLVALRHLPVGAAFRFGRGVPHSPLAAGGCE